MEPTPILLTFDGGTLLVSGAPAETLTTLPHCLLDPRTNTVLAIAPLLCAIFLIRYLPEAKGKLLDEVSPSEV